MQLSAKALKFLDSLALRAKRSFYGMRQGAHRSQRRGHGVEFAEYRQYEVGDNPRSIDWNLYSRSDKLYCKRYLEEENVAVYILIDGSRSLTHRALSTKWEIASAIAGAVGYIALATQDPVMVSILGGPHSPRYWGGSAFGELSNFLVKAGEGIVSDSTQEIDLVKASREVAANVRFPGICVVISDLLFPRETLQGVLAPLRARNMEIHVAQVLGPQDLKLKSSKGNGLVLVDSENGVVRGVEVNQRSETWYLELLNQHKADLRQDCLSCGVSYTEAKLSDKALNYTLDQIRGGVLDRVEIEECALATVARMGLFV